MKQKWIVVLADRNKGLPDAIANYLNGKDKNDLYSNSRISNMIYRWKKKDIKLENKKKLTEAINNVLWTNFTIQDLD